MPDACFGCATCCTAAAFRGDVERMPANCPTLTHPALTRDTSSYLEPDRAEVMRAADATPFTADKKKRNRVEELVHFAKSRKLERLGVAFCVSMTKEAQALHRVLTAEGLACELVCCRVGAVDYEEIGLTKAHPERFRGHLQPGGAGEAAQRGEGPAGGAAGAVPRPRSDLAGRVELPGDDAGREGPGPGSQPHHRAAPLAMNSPLNQNLLADPELGVLRTYGAAAGEASGLCCPVSYDPKLLAAIPREVLERDYGCGDPTPWLRPGETVLDLGSGGGKGVFLAAQVVGPTGRVIGVDMTDDMLALARRNAPEFARTVGFDNVTFLKGRIQDLAVDLEQVDAFLGTHPVTDSARAGAARGRARPAPGTGAAGGGRTAWTRWSATACSTSFARARR